MPAAPPPPGVATHKAAAMAEGKDPDQAVQEARAKVTLIPYHECINPFSVVKHHFNYHPGCAEGLCAVRAHISHFQCCNTLQQAPSAKSAGQGVMIA